jgi:hypothetical protein
VLTVIARCGNRTWDKWGCGNRRRSTRRRRCINRRRRDTRWRHKLTRGRRQIKRRGSKSLL